MKSKNIGAIWIREKIKEKNGRQVRIRYLSIKINLPNGQQILGVAFPSGKKGIADKYPDFLIYDRADYNNANYNNNNLKNSKINEINDGDGEVIEDWEDIIK